MAAVDAYVGEQPVKLVWTVVRGDDAEVDFSLFNSDGSPMDTTDWVASAKATDGVTVYDLDAELTLHVVVVRAPSIVTELWGEGVNTNPAASLRFDISVVKADGYTWTPVVGKILVVPDVS